MDAKDFRPALDVRQRHHDLAVEAARTGQGGVENVGAVGRGDHDHLVVRVEAVHLDENRVERLLPLIVAAADEAGAALAADGVDFIEEDDAGRVVLGLLEQVAHTGGADADEHLDEVAAGDAEERHVRFAGDGLGQQGLAAARIADQQHAARDAAAQTLELLRILQELDDFADLVLGLLDAGDVLERHPDAVFALDAVLAPAEGHQHAAGAAAEIAGEEEVEEPHQNQDRQDPVEQHDQPDLLRDHLVAHGLAFFFLLIEDRVDSFECLLVVVAHRERLSLGAIFRGSLEFAGDLGRTDLEAFDLILNQIVLELDPT